MATKITLRHKASGVEKNAFYGFSWTTFFFGIFPALCRGDWLGFFGSLAVHVVLAFLTLGIGNIVFSLVMCFVYNGWHARRLLVAGYEFTGSQDSKDRAARALNVAQGVAA